jgi:hypothetical protein
MTRASIFDLNLLQCQLADLLDVHPMMKWSPELLQAVTGVLGMYVRELDLDKSPAPVLELVRNRSD